MDKKYINEIIKNRRSIYPAQYSGQKVEDAVIMQMLENANWAPTHKLTQPWHFVVFTGKGLQTLADFQSNLYKEVSTANGKFSEMTFQKLQSNPLLASHIIAICMKRDESERVPEVEEVAAVACAVQNMYLTATAYGIGCYWGSGGVTYMEEAKPFFGLGPKDKLLGFLYIGTPKAGLELKSTRKSINARSLWIMD
jgi:nitroreductase